MLKKILKFLIGSIIAFFLLTIGIVVLYKYVPVPYTPLMAIRSHQAKQEGKTLQTQKKWVPIEKINGSMIVAVIASEDNLFPTHNGFDWKEINNAIEESKAGKRQRGASTISQQTAKNVFLTPNRSFIRKGFEVYFTILIEKIWGKKRIMEVYLNVIEMGPGIYGIEAASQKYFHCSSNKLTKQQSALIAACLPNPLKRNPARPSNYVYSRQQQILNLMPKMGKVVLK